MDTNKNLISEPAFLHLNVHSHYSIREGMCKIPELVAKAKRDGMYAMALTDRYGLFGIKEFLDTVERENACRADGEPMFKPIVGMDAYCVRSIKSDKDCDDSRTIAQGRGLKTRAGWWLTLLAKNKQGYRSLCRLTSLSYTEGMNDDTPRIDRRALAENREGLIVLSGGMEGELAQLIIQSEIDEAEKTALWFKEMFGDDYYIVLTRHDGYMTKKVNDRSNLMKMLLSHLRTSVEAELIRIAHKYGIKLVAASNVRFVVRGIKRKVQFRKYILPIFS